jgi:hypothetical protein
MIASAPIRPHNAGNIGNAIAQFWPFKGIGAILSQIKVKNA